MQLPTCIAIVGMDVLLIKFLIMFVVATLTCQIIVQQILLFFGGKNTYTTLFGPTCLLISEIFPLKPDFHLYK